MTVRTYDLSSRATWGLFTFVLPAVMLGFGLMWLKLWLRGPLPPNAPGPWFPALWFGALGWSWFQSLRIPYRIIVRDERTIVFVSVLGQTQLAPDEVLSIRLRPFHRGMLLLQHARGKLSLFNQFTDFHQFLSDLKRSHPGVELVGC